jgi:hypothetical protein
MCFFNDILFLVSQVDSHINEIAASMQKLSNTVQMKASRDEILQIVTNKYVF